MEVRGPHLFGGLTALLHPRRRHRSSQTAGMRRRRTRPAPLPRSVFAGFRFPCDVIVLAVRWYLRFGLSYRDVEELLAERGVEVDHVTVYRWVQRFTPLLADAARPCRHAVGDRWQVDETYVKVAGRWRYVYRAIDQCRANGDASSVMRARWSALIRGSCRGCGRSTVGVLRLCWLEAGVANDYFLVHAPRPLIEALIRTAGRLAPSRGLCRGVGGAA